MKLNKEHKKLAIWMAVGIVLFSVSKIYEKYKKPETTKKKVEKKSKEYKITKEEEIVLPTIDIKTKNDKYYNELKLMLEEVEATNKILISTRDKTELSKFNKHFKPRVDKLRDEMEKDADVEYNLNIAVGFMAQTYINITRSLDGKSEQFDMNIKEIKKSLYEYSNLENVREK